MKTLVWRSIKDVVGRPTAMFGDRNKVEGPVNGALVPGRLTGPNGLQERHPPNLFHLIDGRLPSKGGRRLQGHSVSQWAHFDALLKWILIYSYDVNWLIASTPYPGRLGWADIFFNRRARMRVRAHWLVDGFTGLFVCQYQLLSLSHPFCGCIFALSPS